MLLQVRSDLFPSMETPAPDHAPLQTKLIYNPIAGTIGETPLQLVDDIRQLQKRRIESTGNG
jgi:hypothetical protein